MARQDLQQTFISLRVVTQRLASTSTQRLPHVVPSLAASLSECRECFLVAQSDSEAQRASEGPVLVHKLKTQISALLQDRAAEARYAAVVLIKGIIEVGGWHILQGANSWVKGIIGILGRPNSTTVSKKLCILTITRIFILTQQYASLVRELTTPSLTAFITSCLNLVKNAAKDNGVLLFILQAFIELTPHHPASFRPFTGQIRALLLTLLSPTPSDPTFAENAFVPSEQTSAAARRLFVSLSICAPKNASSEEWSSSYRENIDCIHKTADIVFRTLIEEHVSSFHSHGGPLDLEGVIQGSHPAPLALPPWTGICGGIERLDGLLQTLGAFISTPSSADLVFPIGQFVNVIERMLSALPPSKDRIIRTRPEISRDEREGLFTGLPRLHVSAIQLSALLISRMGRDAAAISVPLLDQILWATEHGSVPNDLRKAAYEAVAQIVQLFGPSIPKSCAASLSSCIRLCCEDLLTSTMPSQSEVGLPTSGKQNAGKASAPANTDHFLKTKKSRTGISTYPVNVKDAASNLLASALTNLPNGIMSSSLRQQIDRTAILSRDKNLMFASAMNPPIGLTKGQSANSILPFLARAFPEHLEVEALIRPRMPPLQAKSNDELDFDTNGNPDDMEIQSRDRIDVSNLNPFFSNKKRPSVEEPSHDSPSAANASTHIPDTPIAKRQKVPLNEPSALAALATNPFSTVAAVDQAISQPFHQPSALKSTSQPASETAFPGMKGKTTAPKPATHTQAPSIASPQGTRDLSTGVATREDDSEDSDDEMPVLQMDSDSDSEDEVNDGDGDERSGE